MAEKTRFDNIFAKIKNNPVLAIIIALEAISKKNFGSSSRRGRVSHAKPGSASILIFNGASPALRDDPPDSLLFEGLKPQAYGSISRILGPPLILKSMGHQALRENKAPTKSLGQKTFLR